MCGGEEEWNGNCVQLKSCPGIAKHHTMREWITAVWNAALHRLDRVNAASDAHCMVRTRPGTPRPQTPSASLECVSAANIETPIALTIRISHDKSTGLSTVQVPHATSKRHSRLNHFLAFASIIHTRPDAFKRLATEVVGLCNGCSLTRNSTHQKFPAATGDS
jgi:hypothetical protein